MVARRSILAAAFATLTIATAAHADVVAPRRVVVVHVNGTPEETISLEATMRELLGRLRLVMATGNAPSSSVLETVTIDLTAVGAKVVVKNASGSTVLDRSVRGETQAIQREQIAHAVRGAAEAELLVDEDRVAGRAPAVEEPPAPAPTPAPTPAPAPPPAPTEPAPAPPPVVVVTPPAAEQPLAPPPAKSPTWGLDLATFVGGGYFSSDSSVVMRVGGSVGVASRRGLRPSITLAALYSFPFETGDALLSSRTKIFAMRLMPGLGLVRTHWFGLDAQVGGGFDVTTVDPLSSRLPDNTLSDSTTRGNPILSAAVVARASLAADVSLMVTAMLDVDPTSRTYVFQNGLRTTEIFSPSVVRPMLLVGLSFAAFGGGQ